MKLTSKQRAFLKKKAHHLDPMVRIGKDGLTENVVRSLEEVISSRELVKVKILQNAEIDKREVAYELALKSGCELVDIIGKTLVYYKENKEKPSISIELKGV
jgi:RNA-binding protein